MSLLSSLGSIGSSFVPGLGPLMQLGGMFAGYGAGGLDRPRRPIRQQSYLKTLLPTIEQGNLRTANAATSNMNTFAGQRLAARGMQNSGYADTLLGGNAETNYGQAFDRNMAASDQLRGQDVQAEREYQDRLRQYEDQLRQYHDAKAGRTQGFLKALGDFGGKTAGDVMGGLQLGKQTELGRIETWGQTPVSMTELPEIEEALKTGWYRGHQLTNRERVYLQMRANQSYAKQANPEQAQQEREQERQLYGE